jgi:protein transport protein SEC24
MGGPPLSTPLATAPRASYIMPPQQQPMGGVPVARPPPPSLPQHQHQQQPQVVGGYPQPGMAPPQPRPLGGGYPAPPPQQQPQTPLGRYPGTPFSPTAAAGGIPGTPGGGWGAPPTFGAATAGAAVPQNQQGPPFGAPPPPPQQQQPGGVATAPQQQGGMGGRNIDPGSMPRPAPLPPPTQVFETRRENTHTIPPSTEAPIVVRDYGSAGPRYMRSSLNSIPQGADLLKSASLPFVVMINPLALPEHGDSQIDIVDAGPAVGGPLRCVDCKAYVCPYMRWVDNGRKMECCFCNSSNTIVPAEYFSHVGGDGQRRDRDDRPELCRGSVEFDVAGEYSVRPPVCPTYFFLIEVTAGAIGSGATASACASIAQLLDELPGGERTRVGIATFDSRVHFYAPKIALNNHTSGMANGNTGLNGSSSTTTTDPDEASSASQQQPVMLVMSDVSDPFCPLGGTAAAVNLVQHKEALKGLLDSIPKTFASTQIGECAGGAALKASIDALKLGVGGRVLVFLASLPHAGALLLRPREAGRPPSERDTLEVMIPEGKEYTALAQDAAEHQVSIDIFALTQGYVDLATLSVLCSETSGSMNRYNPFNPAADGARFHNDLRWCLMRPQGFEAVARLRVSTGLSVDNYVGAFHRRNPTDLHFPALSCDHTISARLIHDERLREGTEIYLQYALLYTNTEGRRRVRVHTLALPVTRSLGSVFRGADLDTFVAYVAKKVSAQVPGRTIAACREVVIKAAVDTLVAYRKHVATASSSGQLILPESLKLLPLYSLGLTKLACFRTDARADSRAIWMSRLLTASPATILPTLHPRLLELHSLPTRPANAPKVPEKLWLTAERLDPEGIFLLENGCDAHIFIGAAVPPEICTALLNVPSADMVDIVQWSGPPVLDTPLSKAVLALLDEIRRQRKSYMHLRLMRRGHPQEAACMAALIEDRSPSAGMSYVEWLCMLHRQIQNKLS